MGYFKNIDRWGNETNNNSALDFNPVPVDYTPSASGNTTNKNSFVIDPNGDMYFIDNDGDSFYINTSNPLDVLSGVQPTPTGSGNTTNLNSVFKDANGDTWIVDWKGDAIKAGSAAVPETVTTITDTVTTGHLIGSYTNEAGVTVDLNETLTVLNTFSISGNTITLEYTAEDGAKTTKTVDVPADVVTTLTNALTAGNKIGTYTNESATAVDIYETVTSVTDFSIAGSTITLKYKDETGTENTKSFNLPAAVAETVTTLTNALTSGNKIGTYTNESAVVVDIYETVTALANVIATGHKIGDYTNESGVNVVLNETITSVSDLSIVGNVITLKYKDETGTENTKNVTVPADVVTTITNALTTGHKIGTYTNESGVAVDINETVTSIGTITYDAVTGVLTIPYTDEAGALNNKTVTLPVANAFKNLNEFHVDPNGNDTTGTGAQEKPYLTITKALTQAAQGDQVVVHAGVYAENITLSTQNVALVGAQSEYGALSQINGSVTVTASGTSVKIADIGVNSIVHSGSAPLYLENATVYTTFNSSSSAYVEISNSSIQDGDITKSAGIILIEESKIDNVNITGANTVATIRNSYQDVNSTITYGAGTIYNIQNVQGGEVVINASAIPLETVALAQGVTAEMAKEAETADFMKLGMLRPDTEAAPTKYVTWDEVTGRLEVSPAPTTGGASANWMSATTDPTLTGNTGTLPRFQWNTTNDSKWYVDSNGVALLIEGAATGCGTVYFDSTDPSTATIFDSANPPTTNNDALKNLDCAVYIGTDGSVWTSDGTTYKTKTYSFPLHQRDVITATAGQTSFTLTKTPIGGTEKVHVTRNGVDISRAFTWVGNVGTYTPANNYGCTIDANDILQFHYESN